MAVEVPTRSDFDAIRFQTSLDDVVFTFLLKKNLRNGTWTMDVLAQDETPIRQGIKMVVSFPLMRLQKDRTRPPGELVAVDTTGRFQLPGLTQLGEQVVLIYVTEEEVAAL
jgi:hypothetical protein